MTYPKTAIAATVAVPIYLTPVSLLLAGAVAAVLVVALARMLW